jgi:hypothetical protein
VTRKKMHAPRDGDIAICVYCAHVMIYDNGKVRNPEGEEIEEIANDPTISKGVSLVVEYNRRSRT